jgi:hypothetical protein
MRSRLGVSIPLGLLMIAGCATVEPFDYTDFHLQPPRSILVLPPKNESEVVHAVYGYLATTSRPLAEQGYYVFPVEVVHGVLKENGLPTPDEMHDVPLARLFEVFGADAVLYTTVESYGERVRLLVAESTVRARLRLVDARSGVEIWSGQALASTGTGVNVFDPVGTLVQALSFYVVATWSDTSYRLSREANARAVQAPNNGLPAGPYRALAGQTP